ncbi:MAG: cell division ATP-binding protein FtsE [Gammaproteobacteria bacterium]|nr:cell division ATP-binding protein FtsE [Gammaproteobacteria bacterium]MBT5602545.1 cell division ATP-binding protein FtsE [Gammaproteobacteria bacterium]MBT6246053.1 cell division ATP-binding protein FtsE [Gammaproteobacteria bacterium]
MLTFDQVSKRYPSGKEALSGVSFNMEAGEFAFLTGHSGAGKSTLMKLIIAMERPTNGQILFNGENVNRISNSRVAYLRRQVGVVFQNHQLLFDRNVYANVALPLEIGGHRPSEIRGRVRAALSKVGLADRENHFPITLSGGEQQRVGIARAVVNRPPLLLADEPTGNLDPELSKDIMDLFLQFNQVGVTVVIATHDISLVERIGNRRIDLNQGRLRDSKWPI